MRGPDPRKRARREIVAAIIGAEAGAGIGLLGVRGHAARPARPRGAPARWLGAGAVHARNALLRRWLRSQLRAAR